MATRHRADWTPEANGQYTRNLGWKLNERTGGYVQHKFYLGTDRKQAERRNQRLVELWEHEERRHTGAGRATWNSLTLRIAKAFANGEIQIPVERQGNSPEAYARYIHRLGSSYPMVSFVPEDSESYVHGSAANTAMVQTQFEALENQRVALEKTHARSGNTSSGTAAACRGETLHQALDSYIEWIKSDKDTAYSKTRIGQAERLKERHPDVPLASMDFDACEQMVGLRRDRHTGAGVSSRNTS